MTAVDKTKDLVREFIGVELLDANPDNPNVMDDPSFNMLMDNIEKVGLTDPILVRPNPDKPGRYRVVGGHHRLDAAKLHGLTEVPCTIITDPSFDADAEAFQVVRHNVIHGKISPQKFFKMYSQLQGVYSEELAAEMFGFVDQEEFRKLINSTAKGLPKELQKEFKEAAKELKTIDDLSKLLNRLFNQFGDTLPHNYMILDYGGKDSVWIRMPKPAFKDIQKLGLICKQNKITLDSVLVPLIAELTEGDGSDQLKHLIEQAPTVVLPDDINIPTEDFAK